MTNETWIDERGYECGRCACGLDPSSNPDDTHGGLSFCVDCNRATCCQCRTEDERCLACSAAFQDSLDEHAADCPACGGAGGEAPQHCRICGGSGLAKTSDERDEEPEEADDV